MTVTEGLQWQKKLQWIGFSGLSGSFPLCVELDIDSHNIRANLPTQEVHGDEAVLQRWSRLLHLRSAVLLGSFQLMT